MAVLARAAIQTLMSRTQTFARLSANASNPLNRTFDARQQEAILDLVGCLRKNGIDAPDPQFDVNGKLIPTGAIDPGDPKLRKALQECRSQAAAIGAN
jgi:hypothetical protein